MTRRNDKVDFNYVAEIASVMKHPLRLKALMEVGRAEYPINPVVIARANGWPVNDVAYHVRALAEVGAVELTHTEPVRGATKHLYKVAPFGEEILTWARKMERYGRKRERKRKAAEDAQAASAPEFASSR